MANEDYKNGKLVEIVREFNHIKGTTRYEINGITQSIAVPFWREEEGKFKVIPKGSYKFISESGNNYLEITDETILQQAFQFQIVYVYSQISSKYVEDFPELSVLTTKYNELVDDATKLFSYLKSVGMIADTFQMTKVLSPLEPMTTWYMDEQREIKALPISELYGKFEQMIEHLKKILEEYATERGLLSKGIIHQIKQLNHGFIFEPITYDNGTWKKADISTGADGMGVVKDKDNFYFVEAGEIEIPKNAVDKDNNSILEDEYYYLNENGFGLQKEEPVWYYQPVLHTRRVNGKLVADVNVETMENLRSQVVDTDSIHSYGLATLNDIPKTFDTIEKLQKAFWLKEGEVVEVLGYYSAGDGADHKRIIKAEDDGSGVQLSNKLWACIVHNGEVNVSWFGAKGDGVTDDTEAILKATKNIKTVFDGKKYLVDSSIETDDGSYLKGFTTVYRNESDWRGKTIIQRNSDISAVKIKPYKLSLNVEKMSFVKLGNAGEEPAISFNAISPDKTAGINSRLKDIYIRNSNGILLNGWCWATELNNVRIEQHKNYGIRIGNGSCNLISLNNVEVFNGNSVEFANTHGLSISGASVACNNLHLENNWVGCSMKDTTFYSDFIYLEGNRSYDFKIVNSTVNIGNMLVLHNNDVDTSYVVESDDSEVTIENLIISCGGAGNEVIIFNLTSPSNNVVVKNLIINENSLIAGIATSFSGRYFPKEIGYKNYKLVRDTSNPSDFICEIHNTNFNKDWKPMFLLNGAETSLLKKGCRQICNDGVWVYSGNYWYNSSNQVQGNYLYQNAQFSNGQTYSARTYKYFDIVRWSGADVQPTITISDLIDGDILTFKHNNGGVDSVIKFQTSSGTEICTLTRKGQVITKRYFKNAFYNIVESQNTQAVAQLNTPYHVEKMKEEGVYNDFISYMDERTAYDKQQRKLEQDRQLAYEQALKENPELTYEEFMSVQPMMLNLIEEPQPSQALKDFMEKYL